MAWHQKEIVLPAFSRGFHIITGHVEAAIPELSSISVGLLNLFIKHTSASLTINENADPDVPIDLESSFNAIAPENFPYRHTCEGSDDMPAHVKTSMMGASLNIPISKGKLNMGTWQGIYLCEHRNRGGARKVIVTIQGESTYSSGI